MRMATISRGGQLSVPAEVRHRWGVSRVVIEDRGDALVVRPLPDDPIAEARGSLGVSGMTAEKARRQARTEDASADRRHRCRR